MIRWGLLSLFGATPFVFESAYNLEESVRRLSAIVRPAFSTWSQSYAAGMVSAQGVRLYRIVPFLETLITPFFRGAFQHIDGRVHLIGAFAVLPVIKVLLYVWLGGCLLYSSLGYLSIIDTQGRCTHFLVTGMLLCGLAIIAVGHWVARQHILWLSQEIEKALSCPAARAKRARAE